MSDKEQIKEDKIDDIRNSLTDDEKEKLDLESELGKKLINLYEEQTEKHAVWRSNVTEAFKKWLRGEKIYTREKERISLYVSEETKNEWQDFINQNKEEFPTFSELIRQGVKSFIADSEKGKGTLSKLNQKTVSNISHALKEPLTSIKGYSQFLFENENYKEKLSEDVQDKLKNILEQSNLLENRIISFLDNIKIQNHQYDILLIEDDLATIRLITSYFDSKGFICKGVVSGSKGLEELGRAQPKVILLDIILPDLSGYDICKTIKSDKVFRKIPTFFLTAISGSEVEKHLKETNADGYILKPFNFSDFSIIFEILRAR
ncbi:MAG: response regulator [Promethearchaeota archaeon]|jgi:CheY-like chemotaxis protein